MWFIHSPDRLLSSSVPWNVQIADIRNRRACPQAAYKPTQRDKQVLTEYSIQQAACFFCMPVGFYSEKRDIAEMVSQRYMIRMQ